MKTLGGRQFWGDVRFHSGWRIQQNIFTGHHRLIDPKDHRRASGTLRECSAALDKIKNAKNIPAMSGRAVVMVHGILRSSKSFDGMAVAAAKAGFLPVPFDYPSSRTGILEAAGYLNRMITSLDGVSEIHFVVHSMGGLVVRASLSERRDPRIKSMVMLGVPNSGAELADMLRRNPAYRVLFGPAGQQLVTDHDGVIPKLPVPDFDFAVIAGASLKKRGFNPLLRGDDDLIVAVDSARLPGATDFMMVRVVHSLLPMNARVIAAAVRFLQTGCLRKEGGREPIPRV